MSIYNKEMAGDLPISIKGVEEESAVAAALSCKRRRSCAVEIEKEITEVKQNPNKESKQWKEQSIYIVPESIKKLNPKAYTPHVVSIGPYHHGKPHLLPMEKHKHRALRHLLKRYPQCSLDDYLNTLEESLPQLLAAYDYDAIPDELKKDDNDGFLKIMLVDGCFLLEVLYFQRDDHKTSAGAGANNSNAYDPDDPVFSKHGILYMLPLIKRDHLMVENQIPLLVLHKLADLHVAKGSLPEQQNYQVMLHKFFAPGKVPTKEELEGGHHALDLFRKGMIQDPPEKQQSPSSGSGISINRYEDGVIIVRSASELSEAGVGFRRSKTTSLKDISFEKGILRLPFTLVDDASESMFLNLMAFERLHVGAGNDVTFYVFFMDSIIDTERDVSLLHSKKILQNALGSDKAVANLFNSLTKDITIDPDNSELEKVRENVNRYCTQRWPKWRASLNHTYFRSPWAMLSLAGAIFLLLLTVCQTFFAILQYRQSPPSPSNPRPTAPRLAFPPPPPIYPRF